MLQVRDLHVTFPSEAGPVRAVRGLSFDLSAGETMAIVGESGSGKSVTSLAIMGLHPATTRISGSIKLHGEELLGRSDAEHVHACGAASWRWSSRTRCRR